MHHQLIARLHSWAPHVLRFGIVLLLVWYGVLKFTGAEAKAILPLLQHSPLMAWLPAWLGTQGASNVIGLAELSTAALLTLGWRWPQLGNLGALLGVLTFVTTLSFLVTTPGVWTVMDGITVPDGFLLKDVVLLGGCLQLLHPLTGQSPATR